MEAGGWRIGSSNKLRYGWGGERWGRAQSQWDLSQIKPGGRKKSNCRSRQLKNYPNNIWLKTRKHSKFKYIIVLIIK
jgi:hypothetical protein